MGAELFNSLGFCTGAIYYLVGVIFTLQEILKDLYNFLLIIDIPQ